MQAEASKSISAQAANALAMHLRRNPGDAMREPSELAAEFGLAPAFVQSVLQGIRQSEPAPASRKAPISLGVLVRVWDTLKAFLDGLMSHPMLFVLTTLVLAMAAGYAVSLRQPGRVTRGGDTEITTQEWAFLLIGLGTFLLHMICYYRHRRARYALYGGLAAWALLTTLTGLAQWGDVASRSNVTGIAAVALIAFAMMITCLLYAGSGVVAAVIGGYAHMRRQRRQEEQMSRQEMLERYFELQSRLQNAQETQVQVDSVLESPPVQLFQRFFVLATLLSGAALHSVLITLQVLSNLRPGTMVTQVTLLVVAMSLLQVIVVLGHAAIGFFSRSVPWAMLGSLLFSAAALIPGIVAAEYFHSSYLQMPYLRLLAMRSAFMLGVAVVAALGAAVQRRAERDQSLQLNDPAAILAEMVRLQWRLGDRATEVCVMVVDAARSAEMKAAADPLAVEYSFREYLEWIGSVSEACNGKVHSTAGDGAVVSFPSCADAFLAARRIQTDITRFNREDNRLTSPFRLRIGLHVGSVAGDLDQVQFADVIDIAAHVQDVAPISGIVVTIEVASQLPDQTFVPLANPVDGHPVLLVLNPTVDE